MDDEEYTIPMKFEDPDGNIRYVRNSKEFDEIMGDPIRWCLILG